MKPKYVIGGQEIARLQQPHFGFSDYADTVYIGEFLANETGLTCKPAKVVCMIARIVPMVPNTITAQNVHHCRVFRLSLQSCAKLVGSWRRSCLLKNSIFAPRMGKSD